MKVKITKKAIKILDFDVEARPLSWISSDFVSREITAIAASFIGTKTIKCWLLGQDTPKEMLDGFLEMYNEADIVTGHYIRKYDLPIINTSLMELGLPILQSKLTQDTYNDLYKKNGLSFSQENLAAMLKIKSEKIGMNQSDWRDANRLTNSGMAKARRRVIGDIKQHIEMRQKLLDRGMLGPPRIWTP